MDPALSTVLGLCRDKAVATGCRRHTLGALHGRNAEIDLLIGERMAYRP
jgi:hypothetical protein